LIPVAALDRLLDGGRNDASHEADS
jgi:hypothetical protein